MNKTQTRRSRNRKVKGTLSVNAKGFGFVQLDQEPDVFIPYENLGTALDSDEVEALVFSSSRKDRPAGRIVRVLKRAERPIVGVFRRTDDGGVVYPEDDRLPQKLHVSTQSLQSGDSDRDLRSGQIVAATLEEWKDRSEMPVGRVTRILGDQDEPGMDVKIVALSNGLKLEFPEAALKQAERLSMPDMRKMTRHRLDLRELTCLTIDPSDAGDLDDAVSVQQLDNGLFEVGVHIADVSHFVREGSALDEAARERGNSVYFVDQVLPMLPDRLSADLCSLKPEKDRLAYSVLLQLDSLGVVHDRRVSESIIRSRYRFSYEEAQEILAGKSHPAAHTLHLLELISRMLRQMRKNRGSIDFDISEQLISVDEEGIPRTVRPKERLEAHRLVEELMLLANRTIAEHVSARQESGEVELPFVYRNHATPRPEDVENFVNVLTSLGIPYRLGDSVTPDDYRRILEIIQNLDFKDFVEKIALRSMTRAEYATTNGGHFGLAFGAYTHFTSPIRRYADLTVHRLLKRLTDPRSPGAAGKGMLDGETLETICKRCSERERLAENAEREYIRMKSMEFLSRRVGNIYDGVISGVTSFGLFVELTRYLIEGLVPLTNLTDDYYEFDEENYRYVGKDSGRSYRLGDKVAVQIRNVSVVERKAELTIV